MQPTGKPIWTAYYTDDRVYYSTQTEWIDLPDKGVLVVVEKRATGRGIFTGGDWYWLEAGKVHYISSGEWGTWQDPPDVSCRSCIKKGVGVSDEEFQRVVNKALDGNL